jgi:hypothetical protein
VRLSFIQLSAFAANWKRMKLSDDDLRSLEAAISDAPDRRPVMAGTGGLRKIRFAPEKSAAGKSGGLLHAFRRYLVDYFKEGLTP